LYDRFRQQWGDDKVFMDFDSIPYGVDFRAHIREAIDQSEALVVLIGERWLGNGTRQKQRIHDADDFVRFEVSYALQCNLTIIPVLIGNTIMPQPEELPSDIRAIAYRNAVYLDPGVDFHHHASRIVDAVEQSTTRIVGGDRFRVKSVRRWNDDASNRPPAIRRYHRWAYWVVGALCVTGVLIGAALVWRSQRTPEAVVPIRDADSKNASPKDTISATAPPLASTPSLSAATQPATGPATATKVTPFENSIGMGFVPVAGTPVLFSVWETRVRDFRAYAAATNYRQTGGIMTIKIEPKNKTNVVTGAALDPNGGWERPGFDQTDFHPVVAVSWDEAKEFCAWLTKKERTDGVLTQQQEYRLPNDEEWSAAVGTKRYPWGDEWPPSNDVGNYLDEASIRAFGNSGYAQIPGDDGYRYTAPVGRYTANAFGLYDLGGNVFEWCEDRYRSQMNPPDILKKNPMYQAEQNQMFALRPLRGASWLVGDADTARTDFRLPMPGLTRINFIGFRCVLVVKSTTPAQISSATPNAHDNAALPTPISTPVVEVRTPAPPSPERRFAGTWRGSGRSRTSEGSSSTSSYVIRFSDDEKTVWMNWDGPENGFQSSTRRNGESMTWSVRQHPGNTGFSAWKMDCSLTLHGSRDAAFTAKTVYLAGPNKGITGKVEGSFSR
jgi:formylglycine-generating enzyme required for sulfatase activity